MTVAEEQEQYMPITVALYAYTDGSSGRLTRWTLKPEERDAIARGEDVYVMQMYFHDNQPTTPLSVRTGPGDWANDTDAEAPKI